MKKIIYIVECKDAIIYYDTKNNKPLKAIKSKRSKTKKTRKNYRQICVIVSVIFLIKELSILSPFGSSFSGRYTMSTVLFLSLLWTLEFISLTAVVYKVLYKNVEQAVPTNSKEFGYAIKSNDLWNIFNNKKVTIYKKLSMFVLTTVVGLLTISIVPMLYMINIQGDFIGTKVGSEIIGICLLGVMPFLSVLLVWLNNPVRWLNTVEKYQKKKIKYD